MESPFLNLSLLISYFGKVWEIVVIFSETRILLGIFFFDIWEAEKWNRLNKIKQNSSFTFHLKRQKRLKDIFCVFSFLS